MSLARAFTTRRAKQSQQTGEKDFLPQRSNTTRVAGVATLRHKISSPVELIHTTNMLSYNAPDIVPQSATSSASSTKSDDDLSDGGNYTTASSPPTSPDSPASHDPTLPEPNHLSCYFTPPAQKSLGIPATTVVKTTDAPTIPRRAPSHTKKASYEALTRARSNSRLSEQSSRTVSSKASLTFSRSSSSSTSMSTTSRNSLPASHNLAPKSSSASLQSPPPMPIISSIPAVPELPSTTTKYLHPFGQELAQVTEIAEEYGVGERLNIVEAEEKELAAKGLLKFAPEDYLSEIQALFSTMFAMNMTSASVRPLAPMPSAQVEAIWI